MCARKAADTPFDRILELAQHAGTHRVKKLIRRIGDEIVEPADVAQWASAIHLARDVGGLGTDESYALLDIVTERAMEGLTQTDAELQRLGKAMRMIATNNGLSDEEDYYLDDAPAEWLALNRQWEQRFDQIRAELFRQIGEAGMANELLLSPVVFEARSVQGRSAPFDVPEEDDGV